MNKKLLSLFLCTAVCMPNAIFSMQVTNKDDDKGPEFERINLNSQSELTPEELTKLKKLVEARKLLREIGQDEAYNQGRNKAAMQAGYDDNIDSIWESKTRKEKAEYYATIGATLTVIPALQQFSGTLGAAAGQALARKLFGGNKQNTQMAMMQQILMLGEILKGDAQAFAQLASAPDIQLTQAEMKATTQQIIASQKEMLVQIENTSIEEVIQMIPGYDELDNDQKATILTQIQKDTERAKKQLRESIKRTEQSAMQKLVAQQAQTKLNLVQAKSDLVKDFMKQREMRHHMMAH